MSGGLLLHVSQAVWMEWLVARRCLRRPVATVLRLKPWQATWRRASIAVAVSAHTAYSCYGPEADLSWPGQLWPMITILRIISRAHVAPALLLIRKG